MDNNLLQIKIKERLNKLDSKDYDNIECWQLVEAFNKAQIEWVRRQLREDDSTHRKIDDVERLLRTVVIKGAQRPGYFETAKYPADFMQFKNISAKAVSDCCPERDMIVYDAELSGLDIMLRDEHTRPNFAWGETFCTRQGTRVKIYTDQDFHITAAKLTYYRKPWDISLEGCMDISTGRTTLDRECEFKDDVVEILIDECVAILAGDTENNNQMARNLQNSQRNT